jgi:taurine dioxygenase
MPTIESTPLPNGLGARVYYDPARAPNADEVRTLAALFTRHQLLLFQPTQLNVQQLADFASAFGKPDDRHGRLATAIEIAGVRIVENVEQGSAGPRGSSELYWHSDRFFNPVAAGLLYADVVPEEGGDTSFADMYAALAALPPSLAKAIEGRRIKQDVVFDAQGRPGMRPVGQLIDDVVTSPGIETDIVQRHPRSGRPFLYLGNRQNSHIVGLSLDESESLLDDLYAHAGQARFHYRHHWQAGELILYDNRCCMHRREEFDARAARRLFAAVVDTSEVL